MAVNNTPMSLRRLARFLVLLNGAGVQAVPHPQEPEPEPENTITPVTSVTVVDGNTITAVFTPTSFSISGLNPPITSATTVTTVVGADENNAGTTVAIAIAAGAGVVGAGALAAWLFEPAAVIPPAPTEPPAYPTEPQEDPPEVTEEPEDPETETPTTTEPPACPFPSQGSSGDFKAAEPQPGWTGEIPQQFPIQPPLECVRQGEGDQLKRGTDPGFVEELAAVFCNHDQSKDASRTIGKDDLPDGSSWKRDDAPVEKVKFDFKFKEKFDGCADHCKKPYKSLLNSCQYNSHAIFGGGSIEQGCGTYSFDIMGDPRTKLTCNGGGDNPLRNYMPREAMIDAINNFCISQDGKEVKRDDESSWIKESTFTVRYGDECGGSGHYKIEKDLCVKYLHEAMDGCDTDTVLYKHGGTVKDTDNCGQFELHPGYYDMVMCYPENEEKGYINGGDHATVSEAMAQDAINRFCDGSRTIDPAVKPPGGFIQDVCEAEGLASCVYFYRNDGSLVEGEGDIGDLVIRISAHHENPNDQLQCDPPKKYDISGSRCKDQLAKLIGKGPGGACAGDNSKLDLGTALESAEKGCVLWNMYATKTR